MSAGILRMGARAIMLIELYGENFGCFRDEFHLSMLATRIDPDSNRGTIEVKVEGDDEPLRLLRAVAIYGANASGKTTIWRAARALRDLVGTTEGLRSDSPLRPYDPYALQKTKGAVQLGVKVVIDGRIYDYQIKFDQTTFLFERLLRLEANGSEVALFERTGQEVKGEWLKDERFSLFSKDFRRNALLLSLADRLTPSLAKNIAVGIRRLLGSFGNPDLGWWSDVESVVAKRAHIDTAFGAYLLSHVKSADVGVTDLKTEQVNVMMQVRGSDADVDDEGSSDSSSEEEVQTSYRLTLLHRGRTGSFPIPYFRESQGTRRLIELAPLLYDMTKDSKPKAAFIDELDESLHPLLLQAMIRHFNCEIPMEQARGQLIFVTHETSLLDAEAKDAILRRDQVYLTEKDATGAARLYSVAEFKERNNLNLRHRYLQGRYGALPSPGPFAE